MSPLPLQLQQFRTQVKKYVDFSDEEWDVFTEHLYVKTFNKKELLATTGKICKEVGFILEGSFRFFIVKEGTEMSTYFCFQNEFISSYGSFLKESASDISVDAMEKSTLMCFNKQSFNTLLSHKAVGASMQRFARLIAEELVCCYEQRVLSFVTKTPEERYSMLVECQADILQKIPQHYLANYLGVTPVSLSRIRRRIFTSRATQKIAS